MLINSYLAFCLLLFAFCFFYDNLIANRCIYNFTEVQVSRVIIVLLLQNCFVWCKDHTHQAILTTELLELEGWQLNAKISMVAMVDALNSGYMKVLKGLLGNNNII